MIHEIPRLFVNILTVDDKHYVLNRDKLTQPIQEQLSQEEKKFSEFFFEFLNYLFKFKHLTKINDPHS